MRERPQLLELLLGCFGLPALSQRLAHLLGLAAFAAVGAMSLNLAAYMGGTLRAGIAKIERGHWNATALGRRPVHELRHRVLQALTNKWTSLLYDPSLAALIGFDERLRQGPLVVATHDLAFEVSAQ